jgi:MFS family permease
VAGRGRVGACAPTLTASSTSTSSVEAWSLDRIWKYYAGDRAAGYRICRMIGGVRPSPPVVHHRRVLRPPMMTFWHEASPEARRALLASSLGWMLDSFDVMLYALVLASVIRDLDMTTASAGLLGSLTLAASAVGGLLFGVLADTYGRTRALIWSVLIYSVFTALCGVAQSVAQLALFRLCLGFGMGGEWASGAALVSETWPAAHRGKALGLMQSSWAIGYGLAAAVTAIVLPRWGWRAVFFVGIVPALFTLWIRRRVREPELWRSRQLSVSETSTVGRIHAAMHAMFAGGRARLTTMVILMNACTMYAWWGFNLWIPGYLSLPSDRGGFGLAATTMSGLVIAMQVGMWLGYVTFGFICDRIGRKRAYIAYLLCAAVAVMLYAMAADVRWLLVLGPIVAFFGTGYFSGFGALTAELYGTTIRATAQGFTYNIGRIASAVSPFAVGSLAQSHGFAAAFATTAGAFALAAVAWTWIPETRGRTLE